MVSQKHERGEREKQTVQIVVSEMWGPQLLASEVVAVCQMRKERKQPTSRGGHTEIEHAGSTTFRSMDVSSTDR